MKSGEKKKYKEKEIRYRRVSTKRAVGQRRSERRKFRSRQNSHSNRPSNSPRPWPDALPSLFKFHAARTEIRAKSAEFLLDKTPKKFEDEETRRKMGRKSQGEERAK